MYTRLKDKFDYKKTMITLFSLTLLFGVLVSILELIAVPFFAAWLAALVVFFAKDRTGVVLACVPAALSVTLAFFFSPFAAFCAITAVLIALSVALTFMFKRTKPESVVWTLSLFIVASVVGLWIFGAYHSGSASFSSVRDFYFGIFNEFKELLLIEIEKSYSTLGTNIAPEDFEAIKTLLPTYLDGIAYSSPAILAIIAFVVVGFTYKAFIRLIFKYSFAGTLALRWRFTTTNVFVFFYIILSVLSSFLTEIDVFTLTVSNFYTFFNILFAYIGFNFVTALLSQRMRYGLAATLVILGALFFSSVAISLLGIAGAVFTFISNKTGGFGTLPDIPSFDNMTENESENDNETN